MTHRRTVQHLGEALHQPTPAGRHCAAQLLQLLVAWMHSWPPAVGSFLAGAPHLPLLVELVSGRLGGGDADLAGLGAVLLGVCLLYAPGSEFSRQQHTQAQPPHAHGNGVAAAGQSAAAQQVLDVLLHRVGLSQLFGRLEEMKQGAAWQAAATGAEAAAAASGAPGTPSQQRQQAWQGSNPFDAR